MEQDPKRILHVVSSMGRGGTETLIMNIYRNLDRSKVQFDFITHSHALGDYDDEIRSMGGRIYCIPSLGEVGPVKYLKSLIAVMSDHPYAAVHAHTDYQSGLPTLAAKICKIENRICHSHSNNWLKENRFKERFLLKLLRKIIQFSATSLCSCSEEAAAFLFGKKELQQQNVHILKNGIDINPYIAPRMGSREIIRNEFSLPEDAIVLGHIGKFSQSKNQKFILHLLQQLMVDDRRFYVLFAGDGPLKGEVEKEAELLGVAENVRFLGVQKEIPILMDAFDVFLFPSLFEGFGIVMLEAQSSGTPCIASAAVPKSTDLGLGLVRFLDLKDMDKWMSAINEILHIDKPEKSLIVKNVSEKGFNIKENIDEWLTLYGV